MEDMYDKIKMVHRVALQKAVEISGAIESEKMQPGCRSLSQALDDLKDAIKIAHVAFEMLPSAAAK